MRVLLTRPEGESERSSARLRELGHEALTAPLIEIHAQDFALPSERFDAAIATSARALELAGAAAEPLRNLPIYVVGEKTARAARSGSWVTIAAVARDSTELIATVLACDPQTSWLYLAGTPRRPDLEIALDAHERRTAAVVVYAARPAAAMPLRAAAALRSGEVDAVLQYSARSAEIFVDLARRSGLEREAAEPIHVAISGRAAAPLRGFARRIRIAHSADERGLVEKLRGED
jgi:uroporphyrinogen-III synthase